MSGLIKRDFPRCVQRERERSTAIHLIANVLDRLADGESKRAQRANRFTDLLKSRLFSLLFFVHCVVRFLGPRVNATKEGWRLGFAASSRGAGLRHKLALCSLTQHKR